MENWENIHENFAKKAGHVYRGKTYQQIWEGRGFTYEEAREWIEFGFEPIDHWKVKILVEDWGKFGFTPNQLREWLRIGLVKDEDYELASYYRAESYDPNLVASDLEQFQTKYANWLQNPKEAQEYLEVFYPREIRKETESIKISDKNLTGSLIIDNWPQLKKVEVKNNQLTSLTITNCPLLKHLRINNNSLTSLDLKGIANLITQLDISDNKFSSDLTWLASFINLENLDITNNHFVGSLQPLAKMKKLKYLKINETKLDSGLEYLPASLWSFDCSTTKKLSEQLAPYYPLRQDDGWTHPYMIYWLKNWREANSHLVNNAKMITELEQIQQLLQQSFSLKENNFWWTKNELTLDVLNNPNNGFQLWVNERISELRNDNEQYYQSIEITAN